MTAQENAFATYYASMTDAELLRTAANKTSFVDVAQRLLTAELARRHLEVATATHGPIHAARTGAFSKLIGWLHLGID